MYTCIHFSTWSLHSLPWCTSEGCRRHLWNNTIQERFQGARNTVSRYKIPVFNNDGKRSMESRREQHHTVPWATQDKDALSYTAVKLPRRGNTPWGEIRWAINLWTKPTCSTVPARGSITRIFLSLQAVARRLPSVLNDMERTTSLWASRIFTGFERTVSLTSRFQIIIWSKNNKKKNQPFAASHTRDLVHSIHFFIFSLHV